MIFPSGFCPSEKSIFLTAYAHLPKTHFHIVSLRKKCYNWGMNEKKCKVYLDNCCHNRPYDNQSEPRVYLEAHAKMLIQDMIRLEQLDLVTSSVLHFEISKSPFYSNLRSLLSVLLCPDRMPVLLPIRALRSWTALGSIIEADQLYNREWH